MRIHIHNFVKFLRAPFMRPDKNVSFFSAPPQPSTRPRVLCPITEKPTTGSAAFCSSNCAAAIAIGPAQQPSEGTHWINSMKVSCTVCRVAKKSFRAINEWRYTHTVSATALNKNNALLVPLCNQEGTHTKAIVHNHPLGGSHPIRVVKGFVYLGPQRILNRERRAISKNRDL